MAYACFAQSLKNSKKGHGLGTTDASNAYKRSLLKSGAQEEENMILVYLYPASHSKN